MRTPKPLTIKVMQKAHEDFNKSRLKFPARLHMNQATRQTMLDRVNNNYTAQPIYKEQEYIMGALVVIEHSIPEKTIRAFNIEGDFLNEYILED